MEVTSIEKCKLLKSDLHVTTVGVGKIVRILKFLSVLVLAAFVFAACDAEEEILEIPTSYFTNGGAGNQTGEVFGENIVVSIRGSGSITLSGICNFAEITVQSAGNFNGSDLEILEAFVSSRGSGNIYVWATDWLEVEIKGSGNVYYKGNPKITSYIGGSGKLIKM